MVWTLEYVLHPLRPDNMSRVKTTERFFKRFLYTVITNIPPTSKEEKQSLILSKNDTSGIDKVCSQKKITQHVSLAFVLLFGVK